MFGTLGAPELLIIAGVIILIFGVGKISGLGRELGHSITEFRRAVKEGEDEEEEGAEGEAPPVQAQVQEPAPAPPPVQQAQAAAPPPPPAQPTAASPAETTSTDGESSKLF